MKIGKLKKWLSLVIVILFVTLIFYISYLSHLIFYATKADNFRAMSIIDYGQLKIEQMYAETGTYKLPSNVAVELAKMGYLTEFKLVGVNSYTLGADLVSFNPFYDPHYCVNGVGERGVFDNFECEL